MFCSSCGQPFLPQQKFCAACGTALTVPTASSAAPFTPAPPTPPAPVPVKYCRRCHLPADANRVYCIHCGNLLMLQDAFGMEFLRIRDLGMYASASSAVAQRTGTLIIRDDKIIFEQQKTTAVRKLLDKKASASQSEDAQWLMEDIASVEKGRQCGIRSALILSLKDGTSLRFSGNSLNADLLRQAMQLIQISSN